jgi:addiction module HigA family antidote
MKKTTLSPIHPGEILQEEFLEPMNISQYRLAKEIHVPARRINEIVHGKRGISADTALRLARFFELSDHFWINLQVHYDMDCAKLTLKTTLNRDIQPFRLHTAQAT